MTKRYKNYFGTVVFPDDSDPRWIQTPNNISQTYALQALPIGTIVHPSGYAYMSDYNLWTQINNEREKIFEQQRIILREKQIQEEKLRKIEEKKAKQEYEALLKKKKEIEDELNKIQKNYDREIRKITREIDAKYNPQLNILQKELNKVNKIIK